MSTHIADVIRRAQIRTLFQPIVEGPSGTAFGVEALSRGPAGSLLESPLALFAAAAEAGSVAALERACLATALKQFAALERECRLFLNVSPRTILSWPGLAPWLAEQSLAVGIDPQSLVIEVTEHGLTQEAQLAAAVEPLRAMGCDIAIDDLGAGSSGLKSWSAIRPEFVKVDRYFVSGAEQDPVRAEILRSVVDIGRATGSQIVAEGVENSDQLNLVLELGVDYVQGYFLGRPDESPVAANGHLCTFQQTIPNAVVDCAEQLAMPIPAAPAATPIAAVVELFQHNPSWRAIAVVDHSRAIGLVRRDELLILLSRPLFPEVYNRKPISSVMDTTAVQVDARARLEQVSRMLTGRAATDKGASTERDDFIVTRAGEYVGLGRTIDLLRHITAQQIQAAKQANPLTSLPGNRVIHAQVQRLVNQRRGFIACHLDLDHFKPFNDTYGYSHGDQVLLHVAAALTRCARPRVDFVGHIGGDDFVLLMRSRDWSLRLATLLEELAASLPNFHPEEHRSVAAFEAVDRSGAHRRFPLLSVTLAAMEVEAGSSLTIEAILDGVSRTKAQAKEIVGNVCLLTTRHGTTNLFEHAPPERRPSSRPAAAKVATGT
jgi:diguanylate cyclase (GGDEF)-like protein